MRTALPLLLLATTVTAQATKHDLAPRAKKGSVQWYTVHAVQRQEAPTDDRPVVVELELERTLRVEVVDVTDDGQRVVSIRVPRVRGKLTAPVAGEKAFDTDDPRLHADPAATSGLGAPLLRMLRGTGRTWLCAVDARGRVMSGMRPVGAPTEAEDVDDGLRDGLQQLVETAFGHLPEAPVPIGATWSVSRPVPGGGHGLVNALDVTLHAIDDDVAELRLRGALVVAPAPGGGGDGDDPPRAVTRVRDSEVTGAQRVSRSDGLLLDAEVTVSAELGLRPEAGATTLLRLVTKVRRIAAPTGRPPKDGDDGGR